MKTKRVLLLAPHPDDIEAFSSQLCVQTVKKGWEVHEAIATGGEYGTPIDIFKGERIRRIRLREMQNCANNYIDNENGINVERDLKNSKRNIEEYRDTKSSEIKFHRMRYIDGFVPFNKKSVNRLKNFIISINPDVITAPDPFIYIDGHHDHLNLGKNCYFALESMDPAVRPHLMLFYQTLQPNFFLPVKFKKIVFKARISHKSQWNKQYIKSMLELIPILYFGKRLRYAYGKNVEGYRLISFKPEDNIPKGIGKILYRIFENRMIGAEAERFNPTPEDLNLDLDPIGDIV